MLKSKFNTILLPQTYPKAFPEVPQIRPQSSRLTPLFSQLISTSEPQNTALSNLATNPQIATRLACPSLRFLVPRNLRLRPVQTRVEVSRVAQEYSHYDNKLSPFLSSFAPLDPSNCTSLTPSGTSSPLSRSGGGALPPRPPGGELRPPHPRPTYGLRPCLFSSQWLCHCGGQAPRNPHDFNRVEQRGVRSSHLSVLPQSVFQL